MSVYELLKGKVNLKRSGVRYQGQCPSCGGSEHSDKFVLYPDGSGYCFACGLSWKPIALVRLVSSMDCPEAHEFLHLGCDVKDCPANRCRLHPQRGLAQVTPIKENKKRTAAAPVEDVPREFVPAVADQPVDLWREHAGKLVDYAHQALLENGAQLSYLAGRGIPAAAVKKYRLGYIEKDLYRERSAWGLPFEKSEKTGKAKKLWLPQGIVIPILEGEQVHRVRIRKEKLRDDKDPRYHWLTGSGNDVSIIEPQARAFVVVESELDGLACAWAGDGQVGAVPLGTAQAKPKGAHDLLAAAIVIFVALDSDQAGIKAFKWWAETYRQAVRWPIPQGKDPGEYVADYNGDLSVWLQAGIKRHAPVLNLPEPVRRRSDAPPADLFGVSEQEPERPVYYRGTSVNGLEFFFAESVEGVALAQKENPEGAVFTVREMRALKGCDRQGAELAIMAKIGLGGGEVLGVRNLEG